MPYTINLFTNWLSYESWPALKVWLQSAEGGKLRVIEPKDSDYALVRYVKGQSDFTMPHVPWCRSVVVHKESRLPVCVSPPKASPLSNDAINSAISAENFVDGTMLNIYRMNDGVVLLSTRSRLGGNSKFYNDSKTFEEMLNEIVPEHSKILKDDSDAKSVFTSVVLQHPSNRIVLKIDEPCVKIVHQGSVSADGTVTICETFSEFGGDAVSDKMKIDTYNINAARNSKSVENWVSACAQERGFGWQGVVLRDGNGNRYRIRSKVYETVRRCRGNESSSEERFARLRHTRTTAMYLTFYPEDHGVLYELEGRLRTNTRQLYTFYADVFRSRKTPYHELPWPYKHHVSVLHNLFKEKLMKENKKITLDEVIKYVNNLNLQDLANMVKVHNIELCKNSKPKDSNSKDESSLTNEPSHD
jgi:hypothetical protein